MSDGCDSLRAKLDELSADPEFARRSEGVVRVLMKRRLGVDAVGVVLRFMEDHPDLDYGMPGALVHFVERFHGVGYEGLLMESVEKKPTFQTVWMLNRLINGTTGRGQVLAMRDLLARIAENETVDDEVRRLADDFRTEADGRL